MAHPLEALLTDSKSPAVAIPGSAGAARGAAGGNVFAGLLTSGHPVPSVAISSMLGSLSLTPPQLASSAGDIATAGARGEPTSGRVHRGRDDHHDEDPTAHLPCRGDDADQLGRPDAAAAGAEFRRSTAPSPAAKTSDILPSSAAPAGMTAGSEAISFRDGAVTGSVANNAPSPPAARFPASSDHPQPPSAAQGPVAATAGGPSPLQALDRALAAHGLSVQVVLAPETTSGAPVPGLFAATLRPHATALTLATRILGTDGLLVPGLPGITLPPGSESRLLSMTAMAPATQVSSTEQPGLAVTAPGGAPGSADGDDPLLSLRLPGHPLRALGGGAPSRSAGEVRPVSEQVTIQIARAARHGLNRVAIQLDPDALGRVEVRLEMTRDGRLSALILAESREALDLLRADVRTLEQGLRDAGLRADGTNLQFDLRGDRQTSDDGSRPSLPVSPGAALRSFAGEDPPETSLPVTQPAGDASRRLDLFA